MSNRVVVDAVVGVDELQKIEEFCSQSCELSDIVKFIGDEFSIKVSTDKDIVEGFIAG